MLRILKKMLIYLLVTIVVLVVATLLFMQLPQFGKTPTGKRLERILKSPNYREGKFQNQHFTPDLAEGTTYIDILKAYLQTVPEKEPTQKLPSVKTDLKNIKSDKPVIVWFGHSSYLLQIDGKKILVDPVFSGNASPVSFFGKNYDGTNEYNVDDFPELDLLIITHDHYDHLDYETVKKLETKVKKVITSLGTGEHLEYWGYNPNKIVELDWWESTKLDDSTSITSTPARHFSGRGFKRNQSFWSSFVFKTPNYQIYLGGDSGYDSHFKEINARFGEFDLAILECGQYNDMWKYIHFKPEEVVQAAKDLNTKLLLPVHWSKFTLGLHPWKEPIERVTKEAEIQKMPITTPMIGEKMILGENQPTKRWWEGF